MFGNKLRSWMDAVRPKKKQQKKEKQQQKVNGAISCPKNLVTPSNPAKEDVSGLVCMFKRYCYGEFKHEFVVVKKMILVQMASIAEFSWIIALVE